MLIHWCLKGIPEIPGWFSDQEAMRALSEGIPSNWLRYYGGVPLAASLPLAQRALSWSALDNHVNNYASVAQTTPYISLSAGVVVPRTLGGVSVRPAWRTALDFATRGGSSSGFVFRCWTIVSPKPSPSLLHVADEVRDLNIFRRFWIFHVEGEIAAKILIPFRQIEWVQKYNPQLQRVSIGPGGKLVETNRDFEHPRKISNLIEVLS
jgi:hypothetical protein